jgi:hypothetical protein
MCPRKFCQKCVSILKFEGMYDLFVTLYLQNLGMSYTENENEERPTSQMICYWENGNF